MSDIVFKRTKSKPAQRARASTPEDAPSADAAPDSTQSPSTLATKLKKKTRAKVKSRLSFGGEEEEADGEVFQVKKSNLSRKLTLGTHPASPGVSPSSFDSTASPKSNGAPTYSAAYLSELKANTPTTRPSLPTDTTISYDADISLDANLSPADIIDLSGEPDPETAIPSGSSIVAAKQKRERLRAVGASGEDDYISLSVSKRDDFSQGPHPESRLVREEDELGDADDEYAEFTSAQERIALGKKTRKVEAKKRREEMSEMIVDAEEQDEETMEWEQEQLRRGGLRAEESIAKAPKPTYKPAPIPPITPIPTLGAAVARLTQSLTALTTSHAQNSASMVALSEEEAQLETREKEMRDMIARASEKRSWFVAFREWVESVATFLDEKYPQLEKLEDEHLSLLKERADMISRRRQAEDEYDLSLFLGTLPYSQSQEDELDELGRLVPRANPAAARRDRQTARTARHAHRGAQTQEEQGYSTDGSLSPPEAADYETAMDQLRRDAKNVMADVKAEEFADPSRGLGKWFGEWRTKYSDSYTGAWGGLGMVGAWEFWVRLEILGWSPVENTRSLDSFVWYAALYQYSRPQDADDADEDEEPEMGPDGDLVSAMISTAVIPRLCKILERGGFDPYSAQDFRKLRDLAEQIEISVARDNAKFEDMLKTVLNVLQMAVESTETLLASYLALNNPRFNPEAIPARRRFLTRRYKLLRNMLQWRKYSGERFGLGRLASKLVDSCMLPVAESGWEVGGEEYMRKVFFLHLYLLAFLALLMLSIQVVDTLPNELVPTSLKTRMNV
ncbi:nineteen complex-related protein 2-domain-containing protein [Amylocystis lapponica]|nr:nineteen complex-related protein 2-domain-containing protein [Amylocystis lapponica]